MPANHPPHADRALRATRLPRSSSWSLEQAVLLTVLYADLFDYPLMEEEVYRRLIHTPGSRTAFRQALTALTGPYLTLTEGYVTWGGREHLVAVRAARRRIAEALWTTARRYARWLSRVPFVRMVAVSGSLAVYNAEHKSDIDLFCITAPNRLWLARLWIVPLSKLTHAWPRRFPFYLCPNYILTQDTLDVNDQNLFTAYEVTQAVPLWGTAVHAAFRHANPWVKDYLPQARLDDPAPVPEARPRPWYTRWTERLLQGRRGDALDHLLYRCFTTFYRSRADRAGWPWERLAPAYLPDRYTVPEGGYARVIHRLFVQRVHERLGSQIPEQALAQLFAASQEAPPSSVYDWEGLFAREYGEPET